MRSNARIIHSLSRAIVPNAELRLSFTKTFKQSVFTVKVLKPREVRLGVTSAELTTQFPRKKQSKRAFRFQHEKSCRIGELEEAPTVLTEDGFGAHVPE